MFQGEFQGVEKAKGVILEILGRSGRARWSDFEKHGLPKATIHRALKELINEGLVEKQGREYVLVAKRHEALVSSYARQLCEFIVGCNVDKLTNDLLNELGQDILKIDNVYNLFINYVNRLSEDLMAKGGSLLASLIKGFYQNKGIIVFAMIELVKPLIIMKKVEEGCNDIFSGLDENYAKFLKLFMNEYAKSFKNILNIDVHEVLDPLMKLKNVLEKHKYTGVLRTKLLLDIETTFNIREIVMLSITNLFKKLDEKIKNIVQCLFTLSDISEALMKSGCRTLGTLEKSNLMKGCVPPES